LLLPFFRRGDSSLAFALSNQFLHFNVKPFFQEELEGNLAFVPQRAKMI